MKFEVTRCPGYKWMIQRSAFAVLLVVLGYGVYKVSHDLSSLGMLNRRPVADTVVLTKTVDSETNKQIPQDNRQNLATSTPFMNNHQNVSLEEAVRHYAKDNLIVIASFDVTYAEIALNLYLTSFKRFNITNHLFVASDALGCQQMESHGAHCVQHGTFPIAKSPSQYGASDYYKKACLKPGIVLNCLQIGVMVLLVDLDIVFYQDPIPVVQAVCETCDLIAHVEPQMKGPSVLNSGFFLVRPTQYGRELFERVVKMIPKKNPRGDQNYLNDVVKEMNQTIKEKRLSKELFPNGEEFFTRGHRMFKGDNPCLDCVMVHNNYIVSVQAKRYRFKEYGMWDVDNEGYYSNKNRKYIQFENPVDFMNDNKKIEAKSLIFALAVGHIINRTVILPKFHCPKSNKQYTPLQGQWCHFGAIYHVRHFEETLPNINTYRENIFLDHYLVPKSVKSSRSKKYVIDSEVWQAKVNISDDVSILRPQRADGASVEEIRKWFSDETSHVLVFHSMYNVITRNDTVIQAFYEKLQNAMRGSNLMQLGKPGKI